MSFSRLFAALWLPLMPLLAVFMLPVGVHFAVYKTPLDIPILIPVSGVVICMMLGWRFHKIRAVFISVILLITFASFANNLQMVDLNNPQSQAVARLVILLLPINMLIYALLPERSLINRLGFLLTTTLVLQVAVCYWLVVDPSSGALQALFSVFKYRFLPVSLDSIPVLPDLLICLYAVLLVLSLARMALWGQVLDGGVFVASLTLAISSHAYLLEENTDYYVLAAIFAMLLAVIQDSYRMAFIDELTDIPGRRALMNALNSQGRRYAIAMADIDHFKKFNDTYGHDVGDEVLRMVASRLHRVKGGGRAFRYGGEEFTIVFPNKRAEDALVYLEDIRKLVETSAFKLRGQDRPKSKGKKQRGKINASRDVSVTVSIGVADSETCGRDADLVIKAADKALYRAKKSGRNKTVR